MAVVVETTLGDLTVDLYTEERPRTCQNFLKLCKIKYYNFCLFHSVQRNFIAQTGDPTGTGRGGESIFNTLYGEQAKYYEAEAMPKIKHNKIGLLSMVSCGNNMLGSQFFITLSDGLDSLDGEHCVFGEVAEGLDVLLKINETICDEEYRPYKDIRITHTVILEDPYDDPPNLNVPDCSPLPTKEHMAGSRIAPDEEVDDLEGRTMEEVEEIIQDKEAKARATILEIIGDLPDAEMAPPENVLFVCKLNPVTTDEDLEIIFSRFGKINSCEVIRDKKTGDSLQYAFIEFDNNKSCEEAYFKMDNVLIDDRRIHVDFSQSVAKLRWKGKGRGVEILDGSGQKKQSGKEQTGSKNKEQLRRPYDGKSKRSPPPGKERAQSPDQTAEQSRKLAYSRKDKKESERSDAKNSLSAKSQRHVKDNRNSDSSKQRRERSHSMDRNRRYAHEGRRERTHDSAEGIRMKSDSRRRHSMDRARQESSEESSGTRREKSGYKDKRRQERSNSRQRRMKSSSTDWRESKDKRSKSGGVENRRSVSRDRSMKSKKAKYHSGESSGSENHSANQNLINLLRKDLHKPKGKSDSDTPDQCVVRKKKKRKDDSDTPDRSVVRKKNKRTDDSDTLDRSVVRKKTKRTDDSDTPDRSVVRKKKKHKDDSDTPDRSIVRKKKKHQDDSDTPDRDAVRKKKKRTGDSDTPDRSEVKRKKKQTDDSDTPDRSEVKRKKKRTDDSDTLDQRAVRKKKKHKDYSDTTSSNSSSDDAHHVKKAHKHRKGKSNKYKRK